MDVVEVLQQNSVKDNPQSRLWIGGIVRAHFRDVTDQLGFNGDDDFAMRNNVLRHLGIQPTFFGELGADDRALESGEPVGDLPDITLGG